VGRVTQRNPGAWPFLRVVLLVLGAALSVNAVWLAWVANFTIGTAMTALLGLGLLAWAVWFRRVGRVVAAIAGAVLAVFVGIALFLAGFGNLPTTTYDEDAVIVLGAAVHGDELSNTLIGRLDAALAYHSQNPHALIVVTGGQGAQENVAEGVAMASYLWDHGVSAEQVIVESRATSTEENFAFSKALLDTLFSGDYRVAVISDEFHLYRASRLATAAGLKATWLGRATPWYFWPANYLREDLMVIKLWATGS
jgi:uncharacterized SAM-binding protein YcdF (DUF218 family)